MLHFFLKKKAVLLCFIVLMTTCILGTDYFAIQKPEGLPIPEEKMSPVMLSTATPQSTSQWSQNIKTFFPEKEHYYKLAINLEKFPGGTLLNISKFLSVLAGNSFVPLLVLENATSYKFNKIFPGIKEFFRNTPGAEVRYYHTGIARPAAAQKGLSSLAPIITKLDNEMNGLSLDDNPKVRSPKFVEVVDSKICKSSETDYPVEMLQINLRCGEISHRINDLQEVWEQRTKENPFLGVIDQNQIKSFHINDLEQFFTDPPGSTLVLEVSGLLSENDVKKVVDLCRKEGSIRCVRIRDSACMFSSFMNFFDSGSDDEDEGNSVSLLSKDRIRFLDVQTALRGGEYVDLSEYSEFEGEFFINYFVWAPLTDKRFESLDKISKNTHILFGVFLEYLEVLKSEGNIL